MLEKNERKKQQYYYETVWAKSFITITCTASNETSTWRFIINDSSCYFLVDVILVQVNAFFYSIFISSIIWDIYMMLCGSKVNQTQTSTFLHEK